MKQRAVLASLLSVCLAAPMASGLSRMDQELGSIDFPTSGSAAAQPFFIKGVLLMHSFEYDDAREAFVEAQKADPAGFAGRRAAEPSSASADRHRRALLPPRPSSEDGRIW